MLGVGEAELSYPHTDVCSSGGVYAHKVDHTAAGQVYLNIPPSQPPPLVFTLPMPQHSWHWYHLQILCNRSYLFSVQLVSLRVQTCVCALYGNTDHML